MDSKHSTAALNLRWILPSPRFQYRRRVFWTVCERDTCTRSPVGHQQTLLQRPRSHSGHPPDPILPRVKAQHSSAETEGVRVALSSRVGTYSMQVKRSVKVDFISGKGHSQERHTSEGEA